MINSLGQVSATVLYLACCVVEEEGGRGREMEYETERTSKSMCIPARAHMRSQDN